LSKFDSKALEGIFVDYAAEYHAFRIFDKESAHVVEVSNVRFDENDGSRVEQSGVCDVGDKIPPQAIRRKDFYFRALRSLVVLSFPQLLSFVQALV
jgi:hypothetical protein